MVRGHKLLAADCKPFAVELSLENVNRILNARAEEAGGGWRERETGIVTECFLLR